MIREYKIKSKRHNPKTDELEVFFEHNLPGPAVSIPFGDYVYLLVDHDTNRTMGLTIVHFSEWIATFGDDSRSLDEKLLSLVAEEDY